MAQLGISAHRWGSAIAGIAGAVGGGTSGRSRADGRYYRRCHADQFIQIRAVLVPMQAAEWPFKQARCYDFDVHIRKNGARICTTCTGTRFGEDWSIGPRIGGTQASGIVLSVGSATWTLNRRVRLPGEIVPPPAMSQKRDMGHPRPRSGEQDVGRTRHSRTVSPGPDLVRPQRTHDFPVSNRHKTSTL
jgi:hypothetical protein